MSLIKSSATSPSLVYGAAPRVNLLPPLERQRREHAALARRWATGAVAAAVLVALAVLVAALLERSARGDLESERARTTELASKLAAYRDVSTATRDKASYEAYRSQAMASDVTWKSVIGALQKALPGGASITGFDAVVGDGATNAATNGADTAGGTGSGLAVVTPPSGTTVTVTVEVTSMQPLDQTAVVNGFARAPGVLGVDMGSLASASSASYSSTTAVFFDDSVLSHEYAKATR